MGQLETDFPFTSKAAEIFIVGGLYLTNLPSVHTSVQAVGKMTPGYKHNAEGI
jgi:hypothetical protein